MSAIRRHTGRTRLSWSLCVASWLLGIVLAVPAFAADAKEQQLKVSYIYNFAKFVKWPAPVGPGQPFIICVIGREPLSGYLDLLAGKPIYERTIEVKLISAKPTPGTCHILFISADYGQAAHILDDIATLPILSISDLPEFIREGGIIGMKTVDDRVRFDINLAAAQKAGLAVDSQLLKLAAEVMQ